MKTHARGVRHFLVADTLCPSIYWSIGLSVSLLVHLSRSSRKCGKTCIYLGWGWGLEAPAHPSATILWPGVNFYLIFFIHQFSATFTYQQNRTNTVFHATTGLRHHHPFQMIMWHSWASLERISRYWIELSLIMKLLYCLYSKNYKIVWRYIYRDAFQVFRICRCCELSRVLFFHIL